MLSSVKERICTFYKKHRSTVTVAGIFLILFLAFSGFYCISPRNSVIYYDGFAEYAVFDIVDAQELQLDVRMDSAEGRVAFITEDEEQMILAIDQEMLVNKPLSGLDTLESEPYQFLREATLTGQNYLRLTIEMPDDEMLSYRLEIKNIDDDSGIKNEITISNFSENAEIFLLSESPVEMNGTEEYMPEGQYLIKFCDSIKFVLPPHSSSNDVFSEKREGFKLSEEISSFHIRNIEKEVLEFTVDAQTEFREIGHIDMEGTVKDGGRLLVDIADLGMYPIPVTQPLDHDRRVDQGDDGTQAHGNI